MVQIGAAAKRLELKKSYPLKSSSQQRLSQISPTTGTPWIPLTSTDATPTARPWGWRAWPSRWSWTSALFRIAASSFAARPRRRSRPATRATRGASVAQSKMRMKPPAAASPCVAAPWTTKRCMMRQRRARPDRPRPPARVRVGAVAALRPRMMQSSCTRHRRHGQGGVVAGRSPCTCGWALASGEDARSFKAPTFQCFSFAAVNHPCQNVSCCGVARSSESETSAASSVARGSILRVCDDAEHRCDQIRS